MTEKEAAEIYLKEEAKHAGYPYIWWWLSFADDNFLGVCIVQGRFMMEAVVEATTLKLNPGGQVVGQTAPEKYGAPPAWARRRLMTDRIELDRAAVEWTKAGVETVEENMVRRRS